MTSRSARDGAVVDEIELEATSRGESIAGDPSAESPRPIDSMPARWLPAVVLAILLIASQVRTGVAIGDVARYSAYWLIAVLAPGIMVARALLGVRKNLVEDLSIGAVTGVSLEVVMWIVGVTTGLGDMMRFWWIVVLAAGAAVPAVRQRWMVRVDEFVPFVHGVGLAGSAFLVLARFDVFSFRAAPLAPEPSSLFHDLWWHLSLVQELMKFERPQVPQVVGEPLNYHFFSHVHVAFGSRLSGVLPEVVLLRLWVVPIVLVSIGLAFSLGRMLTSSMTGGVLTAWLAFAVVIRTYVWVGISGFASSPMLFHSPSQLLANVGIVAVAIGIVMMFREERSAGLIAWVVLIVVVAGGAKSTIVPVVIAATLLALAWALVARDRAARMLGVALGGLLVLQAGILALASGTSGGSVVPLGILKSLPIYRDLVPSDSLLGVNDGLLLETITSPGRVALASASVFVMLAMHSCRIAGMAVLARRDGRSDLVNWWLSGAVVAGFAATLMIDHVGLSQTFFVMTAAPLGAALTVSVLWSANADGPASRRTLILRGLAAGVAVSLLFDYFIRARQRVGGYGAIDRIVFPVLLIGLVLGLAIMFRDRLRRWAGPLLGFALAVVIGILIPGEIEFNARAVYRFAQPVEYPDAQGSGDYQTGDELEAMMWLRDNSDPDDVIMTNVHCRPIASVPLCDARGFWVVGLSGRRAVMEGWGYTSEAQALHGVEGRVYARQPSPFAERAALNDAVFDNGDVESLRRLRAEAGATWIVQVARASPSAPLPDSAAVVRFENDDVRILEVVL